MKKQECKMCKRAGVFVAILCMAGTVSACGNNNSYDVDRTDGVGSDKNVNGERGALAAQLDIPLSANEELSVDGTELKSIMIDDKDIIVPDKDWMYTKTYKMVEMTDSDKEKLIRSIFDEDGGIYNYPQEYFDDIYISRDTVEKVFDDRDSKPDFGGEYFVGKIDGEPYVVRFMFGDVYINKGFAVVPACLEEIPGELMDKSVTQVTYYDYNPDDVMEDDDTDSYGNGNQDQEMANSCGLDPDQAVQKAAEYMDKLGFLDVTETSVVDMYRAYEDDGFRVVKYEKDGYKVRFEASVNGVKIYQPISMAIDTMANKGSNPDNAVLAGNYFSEISYYELSFNENGIISFYGFFPMTAAGELERVDELIKWNDAVDGLRKAIPEHFQGYTGYSQVVFNDVRLTYFRTMTENGQYEVIPVYVFSQVEEYDTNQPIQLIMIDARDGSEVALFAE